MAEYEQVPEGVDPPRLKFYEEVQLTFQRTVDSLCRTVPELKGAVISLVWDLDLPRDLPHGLILGKQTQAPQFMLRAAEQTNKTLQNLISGFMNHLMAGDQAASELNKQIVSARQELHELQEKIKNAKQANVRVNPDDPRAT